jgi:type I restriction-modification system DNA methylase subunit
MKDELYYFHQTPNELAKLLIEKVELKEGDVVLEPFRGEGSFYNNFPDNVIKEWTELEEGKCYTSHTGMVDWVITNPPFKLESEKGRINSFWFLLNYFINKVNKGIAFLANDSCFGTLTPKRIIELNEKGLYLKKFVTCSVKKWRGRYFLMIFTKEKCNIQETILGNF